MIMLRNFIYRREEKVFAQFLSCIDAGVTFVEWNKMLNHPILKYIMTITEAKLKMVIIARHIAVAITFHRFNGEL